MKVDLICYQRGTFHSDQGCKRNFFSFSWENNTIFAWGQRKIERYRKITIRDNAVGHCVSLGF